MHLHCTHLLLCVFLPVTSTSRVVSSSPFWNETRQQSKIFLTLALLLARKKKNYRGCPYSLVCIHENEGELVLLSNTSYYLLRNLFPKKEDEVERGRKRNKAKKHTNICIIYSSWIHAHWYLKIQFNNIIPTYLVRKSLSIIHTFTQQNKLI